MIERFFKHVLSAHQIQDHYLLNHKLKLLLICPEGKNRVEYCDTDVKGLYVLVSAANPGEGGYYLRYKDGNAKTCHQKIGRTKDVSLTNARKEAGKLRLAIAQGANPVAEKKAQKAIITFAELMEQHYLPYVMRRKRSWKKDEEMHRLRLNSAFGSQRLNQITRQKIQAFHTALKNDGLSASTCNHYVKLLKQAFNLAIDWGMLETNPASRIPLFREEGRENYLNDVELEQLLTVLRTDENRNVCQVVMFLLSTGARLNEALQATWSQIDRAHRVWRIPASNSKSKKVRSVPLNDSAIDVLDQLNTEGHLEHLFVNRQGEHYSNVHKIWGRLRRKAGLPHLRIHDLRHQYASFLVNSGRTLYEVQQILGHSDPSVTQRYAHLSTKSLQEAANSASVILRGAMQAGV